jgi:hypothetical protein
LDCAAAAGADPSPCDLSVTTPLLFEPLAGAIGSAVAIPLILSVTEISWGCYAAHALLSSGFG